jgi:hypothetical protein
MKWWMAVRDAVLANPHGLSLQPDDCLFIAMLTAWVILVTVVTYLLLGWESAGALIGVAGLFAIGTIAVQSRPHRRQDRQG